MERKDKAEMGALFIVLILIALYLIYTSEAVEYKLHTRAREFIASVEKCFKLAGQETWASRLFAPNSHGILLTIFFEKKAANSNIVESFALVEPLDNYTLLEKLDIKLITRDRLYDYIPYSVTIIESKRIYFYRVTINLSSISHDSSRDNATACPSSLHAELVLEVSFRATSHRAVVPLSLLGKAEHSFLVVYVSNNGFLEVFGNPASRELYIALKLESPVRSVLSKPIPLRLVLCSADGRVEAHTVYTYLSRSGELVLRPLKIRTWLDGRVLLVYTDYTEPVILVLPSHRLLQTVWLGNQH